MLDLSLGLQPKSPPSAHIRDTGTEAFENDVLKASMARPVIVDFWAPWCGPCKQMMPVLEKAVNGAAGAVAMVRVDIDKHPQLAQIFGVQSVPTVFAFFQGHPVDGFAGSKPESELKAFVAKLVKIAGAPQGPAPEAAAVDPAAVAKLLAEADTFFRDGDVAGAMERYGLALDADPASAQAFAGIGWCLFASGDTDSVREMAGNAPDALKNDPRVKGLSFVLERADESKSLPPVSEFEKKILADPKDHPSRYGLALKKIAAGDIAGAVEALVELTRRDRTWNEQKARKLLVDLFDALGPQHPQTAPGRRKLSSVLFS